MWSQILHTSYFERLLAGSTVQQAALEDWGKLARLLLGFL